VFAVLIPDNMKAIVDKADAIDPKLNDAFREYANARGFAVDPTRIRSPCDKLASSAVFRMCVRISLPEKSSGI
jgi:transposase